MTSKTRTGWNGGWGSVCLGLLLGCGHVSTITTKPEGGHVFLNGTEVCDHTPCGYDGKVGMARRYHLQIQKSGFEEVNLYVDRELNLTWFGVALFAGLGAPFATSFVYNLDDSLSFELVPLAPTAPPAVPAPPAPTVPTTPAMPPAGGAPAPPSETPASATSARSAPP